MIEIALSLAIVAAIIPACRRVVGAQLERALRMERELDAEARAEVRATLGALEAERQPDVGQRVAQLRQQLEDEKARIRAQQLAV